MSRMLHELTNSLSVLAGHVQLIGALQSKPSQLADSLRSIQWASDSIGEIVERYADFRRQVPRETAGCELAELCAAIRLGHPEITFPKDATGPGWQVSTPEDPVAHLQLEARWLRFAVWELARSTGIATGNIRIYAPEDTFDRRGLKSLPFNPSKNECVYILISWRSDQPTVQAQELFKPSTVSLALTIGIVRWASGHVCYEYVEGQENRFWIVIPAVNTPAAAPLFRPL